jgi:glycosyltransferase involved in cell wall biosynthesis
MNPRDVSVIITCKNEALNIARCLESVRGFGDTIVVDSFSTDETAQIVRRYPVTLYLRPYRSAARQKNWALDRVHSEWVLILDADEAVTPQLRGEIESIGANGTDGYWIRRRSEFLGRMIVGCGWQRDKVLRLFRVDRGRYDDVEVHEEIALDGRERILRHPLMHYPYRDVDHHMVKIDEYSTRGAKDYIRRGGRLTIVNMIVRPPLRFLRMYLFQRGFMDGKQGMLLCLLASYSVFLKYAKAWELKQDRVTA